MKKIVILSFMFLCLTGCADDVSFSMASTVEPVGFWYGLWHGWIAGFAFIISLFDSSVSIYAVYNNGGWYDFGYVLGINALITIGSKTN